MDDHIPTLTSDAYTPAINTDVIDHRIRTRTKSTRWLPINCHPAVSNQPLRRATRGNPGHG
jgi:hypothetical protein